MATKRFAQLLILAILLGLSLSVGTAFSAPIVNWFTLRVVGQRAVVGMDGQLTGFMSYHILDYSGIIPGCFLVLRDNTTGHFTTTEVHASACGIGEQ